MADIFLSYARGDRQEAESLARALQDAGWSVWWDRSILPGSSFEQVIAREISAARCVVVLWSAEARESNWVRDEATLAQSRNVLVSVLIDNTDLPLGFRQQQAANLTAWTDATTDPEFQLLTQGIAVVIAGSGAATEPSIRAAAARGRGSEPAHVRRGSMTQMTSGALSALAVIAVVLIGAVIWSAGYRPLRRGAPKADDSVAARGIHRESPSLAGSVAARPNVTGAQDGSTVARDAATSQTLVVPPNAEATLPRQKIILTVLAGQLRRLNVETRTLSLHIRFANNGTRILRTYHLQLRLLVDGVPRAPTEPPLAQIETLSAREFDYVFEVPATATRVVLRVSRDDETSDIPLDLTATRP